MAYGILIGVALTLLTAILSVIFFRGKTSVLSYIIMVMVLIPFSIEGIAYVQALNDKEDTSQTTNTVVAIQEAALVYVGDDVKNYKLGMAEASAIKAGLRFVYPSVEPYIEPSDFVGKTISESAEVLRKSVIRSADHRICMAVLWMAVTLVVAMLLMLFSNKFGNVHQKQDVTISSSSTGYTSSRHEEF